MTALTPVDRQHLTRAIDLAVQAREAGNEPFGALLADAAGQVVAEDRNTQNSDADPSAHAELNLLRHLDEAARPALAGATMYASGEPCPMCAALIYQCGIDRVVFAVGAARFRELTGGDSDHLHLTCAEVMARGERAVEVIGPAPGGEGEAVFL